MIQYKLNFIFSLVTLIFLFFASWRAYSYAEIHYTFFGYSLISRNYPEIVLDTPWRVGPGEPIPLVCIIKDADRYPIELERITARFQTEGGEQFSKCIFEAPEPITIAEHYWYRIDYIEPPAVYYQLPENIRISIAVDFSRKGRRRTVITDNLPGLSHAPLNTLMSPYSLPALDGWFYGDPHYHSDMTQDQVEFGAPAEVAMAMGKAIGLSWVAITDHSYDLDIAIGEFFKSDNELTRWRKIVDDANRINSQNNGFIVVPAEEVSCGNHKNHNIHLLAFNKLEFISGKGDGVKRGFNRKPDFTLKDVLEMINNKGGFAYASHPEEGNGFMGTLLLKRGHWGHKDYSLGGYSGLQFWNGERDKVFDVSYNRWKQLLLEGHKLFILGGNDAHGDFNRYRGVKYPNTKLKESDNHIFGKIRTYAYCGENFSLDSVLNAMENGKTIVTNGPVAALKVQNDNGRIASVGDSISGRESKLIIKAASSKEFGQITKVDLIKGSLSEKQESLETSFIPENNCYNHDFTYKIEHQSPCYLRLEASSDGEKYSCFTSPIWLLVG